MRLRKLIDCDWVCAVGILNMNDIFKLFKKRAQSGKSTNITDVIKDLNEKEQNEILGAEGGRFDRANKSYLSISKSGRLKSKKSQSSRALQEDLFNPVSSKLAEIASRENNATTTPMSKGILKNSASNSKPLYDQNSDNADSRASSTSSSFRSSYEELNRQEFINSKLPAHHAYHQTNMNRTGNNLRYMSNVNTCNNNNNSNAFKRF